MNNEKEKINFLKELKKFASTLSNQISVKGEWNVRGFIDIFKNIYTISDDTKVISKILELHLFPYFLSFAEKLIIKLNWLHTKISILILHSLANRIQA